LSIIALAKCYYNGKLHTLQQRQMGLLAGHTGSWAPAYPEIVTCHGQFWLPNLEDWSLRFAAEPGGVGQLNPLHPQTYKVVKNVINEVADMFPDNFFHGGGDEVTAGCWNNSTDIQVQTRTLV
jgi:hexosaminidase